MNSNLNFDLGRFKDRVDARVQAWQQQDFLRRLWNRDHTLWCPESAPELAARLGWLSLPQMMYGKLNGLLQFAEEIKAEGFSRLVLLGMGGSSLAPEVFGKSFGSASRFPGLVVLDSTHPDAVQSTCMHLDMAKTLFLVSSKSGVTLETLSLFRYFWNEIRNTGDKPGRHFVAITDPDSPLMRLAEEREFRAVFQAPADVGGRYSALSVFGLVPAALIGVDIRCLLSRALTAAEECSSGRSETESSGMMLGAALGELAGNGNKFTLITSSSLSSFADWAEQLVAESTGKEGRGILPLVNEPFVPADRYRKDRLFVGLILESEENTELEDLFSALRTSGHPLVRIHLADCYDLGREFFLWEVAVAAAGAVMGVNPFDQPDVQLSKDFTQSVIIKSKAGRENSEEEDSSLPETFSMNDCQRLVSEIELWTGRARPGDYIAIQAYLAAETNVTNALQGLRSALGERTRLAITMGYGPRFLHSTGQLHKGGPNNGLFIQLVDEPRNRIPVPETDYTFNSIIKAQAIGDYKALKQRRRRILRINLGGNPLRSLDVLRELVFR